MQIQIGGEFAITPGFYFHAFAGGRVGLTSNRKNLKLIILFCLVWVNSGCVSQESVVSIPGLEQLGPSGYGFQHPIWSPDGSKIAVTTQTVVTTWTSNVYLLDIKTGNLRTLVTTKSGSVRAVAWSPDGNRVLLASQRGGDWPEGIWSIGVEEGSSPEFLVTGYYADWSPNGKGLAVYAHSEKNAQQDLYISIIDIKTREEDVVFSRNETGVMGSRIAWSPDGKVLIFDYGRPATKTINLYLLDIATKEVNRITEGGENYDASWSPNGDSIVYVNDAIDGSDSTLVVADKDNICRHNLLTLRNLWGPSWSPDGKHIAFVSWGRVYLLALDDYLTNETKCS